MFRYKVNRLLYEFGVKQEFLVALLNTTRGTFKKKLDNNSFSDEDQHKILKVYGKLL